jgi:hypothetical protein
LDQSWVSELRKRPSQVGCQRARRVPVRRSRETDGRQRNQIKEVLEIRAQPYDPSVVEQQRQALDRQQRLEAQVVTPGQMQEPA